ncbi:MAG: cell wall-binding protein [Deltaproteobacteria bacterium]|nr:cell wall-binding protein [Deltaproteobacteria bacterium]
MSKGLAFLSKITTLTKYLVIIFLLLTACVWWGVVTAEVISGATLGNLTGPVDTHFMPDHHLYDVVWGNEKFVAVGSSAFDETEVLLSADGLKWERVSLGKPSRPLGLSSDSAGTLYGVTWNGSTFVTVGERVLASSDGKSWTVTAAFATCVFSRVIAQGGMFVAVGGDRGRGCITTSADGRVWTERTSGIEGQVGVLSGITWNGATFIAVGRADLGRLGVSSVLLSSANGTTWSRQRGPADFLVDLAWGSGVFVAVGGVSRQGALFTSPDLQEWTDRTPPRSQPLRAVLWSGSLFVAVGVNGTILTSTDGTIWSERKPGTDHDLLGVAYNGSLFVVVGDGIILTSQDGEQWRTRGGN